MLCVKPCWLNYQYKKQHRLHEAEHPSDASGESGVVIVNSSGGGVGGHNSGIVVDPNLITPEG
jgi:hypothetical protein